METTSLTTTAKNALANTGKAITGNPKNTLYIGVGIAALIGIYFAYDAFKNVTDGFGADPRAGGGNVNPNDANEKPRNATITRAQAQTAAANILSAFRSIGQMNNNEFDILKNALRHRNATDYALISEAFGKPARSPTGNEVPWWVGEKLNLSQWISFETKDWQKAQLRQILPDVF